MRRGVPHRACMHSWLGIECGAAGQRPACLSWSGQPAASCCWRRRLLVGSWPAIVGGTCAGAALVVVPSCA